MLMRALNRFLAPPIRTVRVPAPSAEAVLLALWICRAQMPRVINGAPADCTIGTARDVLVVLPAMIREASEELDARAFAERAADEEAGWPR